MLLQALAALFIANSHLEGLYPKSWMAADGFIGNSMFFLLSGYGITLSLKGRNQNFVSFYWRRILRIYPVVWIVLAVFYFGIGGKWRTASAADYFVALVYPTWYGYVRQVMLFYILFFFLKQWLRVQVLLWLMALLFMPLIGFFLADFLQQNSGPLQLGNANPWLWWVFFFQVMLFGGVLALRVERPAQSSPAPAFAGFCACFLAYVALKFLMVFGVEAPVIHLSLGRLYILLHLLMFPLLYCAFISGTSAAVLHRVGSVAPLHWLVTLIGGLTLEIYAVHWFVFENPFIGKLAFPVNVAAFFGLTILISAAVAAVAARCRRLLEAGVALAARKTRPAS